MCPFCVTSDVHLPPPGATATRWAPPTGSVTSEQGSASASQASPASTVTDARATTLALAPKAVNVSLEGRERGRWEGCCTPSLAFAFLLPLGRYSVTLLRITAEVGTFLCPHCVMKFDFCTIAYPLLLLLPFSCLTY